MNSDLNEHFKASTRSLIPPSTGQTLFCWIFGGLLLLIGFASLYLAFGATEHALMLDRSGWRVNAKVLSCTETLEQGPRTKRIKHTCLLNFTTPSGAQQTAELGSKLNSGQIVQLLVDPTNPKQVYLNNRWQIWLTPLGLVAMGICFPLFGLLIFLSFLNQRRLWRDLLETAQYITATVCEIKQETERLRTTRRNIVLGTTVSSERFYKLYSLLCQYQDPGSGNLHWFRSPPRREKYPDYVIGKTVKVLVKAGDFRRYYVDVGSLE